MKSLAGIFFSILVLCGLTLVYVHTEDEKANQQTWMVQHHCEVAGFIGGFGGPFTYYRCDGRLYSERQIMDAARAEARKQ